MEARAIRKHVRSSPRKVRLLVNLVRGKGVAEAISILQHLPHRASRPVEITISSAVHNLRDRFSEERIEDDGLIVREIKVDGGAMFKRHRPVSRGRGHAIRKRTCHITVVVGTKED